MPAARIKPEVMPMPMPNATPRTTASSNVTYPGGYGVQQRDQNIAAAQRPVINPLTGRPKSPEPDPDPSGIDTSSVKKHFGWVTIDKHNLPILFRSDEKYTSVRIVEDKFLKHFPSTFSDELGDQSPLISYYVTAAEAKLLNEINFYHCGAEFGKEKFTVNDLIVKVSEFMKFLNLVKQTFPEEVVEARKLGIPLPRVSELRKKTCGWIQVNNTISPYLRRDGKKYVISNVMRHAAQLPLTSQHEEYLPTDIECTRINGLCQSAGFDFQFGQTTKFISLDKMRTEHNLKVVELPQDNPRDYARYTDGNANIFNGETMRPDVLQTIIRNGAANRSVSSNIQNQSNSRQSLMSYNNSTSTARQLNSSQARQPYPSLSYSLQNSASLHNASLQSHSVTSHGYPTQTQQVARHPLSMTNTTISSTYSNFYNSYNQSGTQKKSNYTPAVPMTTRPNLSNLGATHNTASGINYQVRMRPASLHVAQNGIKSARQMPEIRPSISSHPTRPQQPHQNTAASLLPRTTYPSPLVNVPRPGMYTAPNQQPIYSSYYPALPAPYNFPMVMSPPIGSVPVSQTSNIHNTNNAMNNLMLLNNQNLTPSFNFGADRNVLTNGYAQTSEISPARYATSMDGSLNHSKQSRNVTNTRQPVIPQSNKSPSYLNPNDAMNAMRSSNSHMLYKSNSTPVTLQMQLSATPPALIADYTVQTKNILTKDYNNYVASAAVSKSSQSLTNSNHLLSPSSITNNSIKESNRIPRLSVSTEALSPNIQHQAMNNLSLDASQSSLSNEPVRVASDLIHENPPAEITSHTFEGKGISCVNHKTDPNATIGVPCALLEAVQKLYFKDTPLPEFEFVIQKVLDISTWNCSVDEERAFVSYYELPTEVLNSSKLIKLTDLESNYKRLTYMFNPKKSDDDRSSVSSSCTTPSPGSPPPTPLTPRIVNLSDTEDADDENRPRKKRKIAPPPDDDDDVIILD